MTNETLTYYLERYEEKLKRLMSKKDYARFVEEVAKEGFRKEIEGMAESDFKDFVLGNFDRITDSQEGG